MAEPTVQVPVSLIEQALKYDTMPPGPRVELRALVSRSIPHERGFYCEEDDPKDTRLCTCKKGRGSQANEETSPNETQRHAGYQAVWDSGLLTEDVYTNARIWRAVEAAITAAVSTSEDAA